MYRKLDRMAALLARSTAILGGIVLVLVIAMTCVSIIGRSLVPMGLGPIHGDFEWVEMGIGFAVFAFLPWCQYMRAHASVDLLKPAIPTVLNRLIDLVADVVMLIAAVILTQRLWVGMLDKQGYGETTFILQFPLWISYATCLLGLVALVLVAAFCALRSARAMTRPLTESDQQ